MGSTVIQSTRGRPFCTAAAARLIRCVQWPPMVHVIAPSAISGPRIAFPCRNLAQRSDRSGWKVWIVRQRGSVLYRRRRGVSLVRWGRSRVVIISRRMWRVSITRPGPRWRGRPLSSWRIRLSTTSVVERPTRTRTRRRRPLMRRRTIPKCILMWRRWVEIRMRIVVIIRWVLLLLLLWWHRRLRETLHRRATWSGSSSSWTTTSPMHVMMIGIPRRWRAGLVWRTSAPFVEVGVIRWWVLGVSRWIIPVLWWHRRSGGDRGMMASALIEFVRGFVRGHSLKKKERKKNQASERTPNG